MGWVGGRKESILLLSKGRIPKICNIEEVGFEGWEREEMAFQAKGIFSSKGVKEMQAAP